MNEEKNAAIGMAGLFAVPIAFGVAICAPVVGSAVAAIGAASFVRSMIKESPSSSGCGAMPPIVPLILMMISVGAFLMLLVNFGQMLCLTIAQCNIPSLEQMVITGVVCILSFVVAMRWQEWQLNREEEHMETEHKRRADEYRRQQATKTESTAMATTNSQLQRVNLRQAARLTPPSNIPIQLAVESVSEDGIYWFELRTETATAA